MKILEKSQVPAPIRAKMEAFGFPYAQLIDGGGHEGEAYELFLTPPGEEPPFPTGLPVVVIYNGGKCRTLTPEESEALLSREE